MPVLPRRVPTGLVLLRVGPDGGPVRDNERVLVVAEPTAWAMYERAAGYVCPAGTALGGGGRLAFYNGGQVQGVAARIVDVLDSVDLSPAAAARHSLSVDPVERRIGDLLTVAWVRSGKRTSCK